MDITRKILICLVCLSSAFRINGQDSLSVNPDQRITKEKEISGFIRGGAYAGIDHNDGDKPYVSSLFSDLALKMGMGNGLNYKAFADLRFRYGSEFSKPVNRFNIREGYVKAFGQRWDLSAGQQIVKWGRADFTNPTSKLNPQNYISRSPDREDMDMGNLLAAVNWYPSEYIKLGAVVVPYYSSSVLLIDPIPLPENVTFKQINSIITDKKMFTYGLKADVHLSGIDMGLSWFDGYDPMPGTALTKFSLDMSGQVPVPLMELANIPYKVRMLGLDFETAAGNMGIRGEGAWTFPYLSFKTYEYVPLPELRWVMGIDWTAGIWRFTAEYSGKDIPGFIASDVDPVFGTEPDYAKLAELLAVPGFDMESYVRQQVAAFNRLYNYQLKKSYHSGGIKIDADLVYGKLVPSVFTMYNFTSHDLLLIPEIKFKPADGFTITAGAEFYSGKAGSLYDIADEFMNSVYVALKVDF